MALLAKHEKKILLQLARQSIEEKLLQGYHQLRIIPENALNRPGGVFVTLHRFGALRGCIGRIRSHDPLYHTVQEMAVAAATQDPRFLPVTTSELSSIVIEISVLSVPEIIQSPSLIEIGKHGLIVSSGIQSGLLLPQVATEWGWDAQTFLSHTCEKAGLPMDFWKYGQTKIETFTAEVFSEKDMDWT